MEEITSSNCPILKCFRGLKIEFAQIIIWIVFGILLMFSFHSILSVFQSFNPIEMASVSYQEIQKFKNFEIPPINIWLVITFILYFLLAYFLFSTSYAGIGSAVEQEQDAQCLSTSVLIPLILPILFSSLVMTNPDGILSVILSIFLFFSLILMIIHIATTSVPMWEIIIFYFNDSNFLLYG